MRFGLVLFLMLVWRVNAQTAPDLKQLYDEHRWFDLRDALRKSHRPPKLYQGAVASAFNDTHRAEKQLQAVVKAAPQSHDAAEAHGLLGLLYFRSGIYSKAVIEMKAAWDAQPANPVSENERAIAETLTHFPDQSVVAHHASQVQYRMDDFLRVPLTINGKPATFLIDSDINVSLLNESEARRFGMEITDSRAKAAGVTGAETASVRTAVASEIVIGKVRLKNVAFFVLADDQSPFSDLPVGERGAIGLPVLLALRTLRWSRDGDLEIAFSSKRGDPNLCFDETDPITQAEFQDRKLEILLDFGSNRTQLWPPFARDFQSLMASGTKSSERLNGISGGAEIASVELPELTFRAGGLPVTLRPAPVLMQMTVSNSKFYYGRMGIDLLKQARQVTIDFKSMRLTLE